MFESSPLIRKVPVAPERPAPPDEARPGGVAMLSPTRAWRMLCSRTGGAIALVTFYRWLRNGRVYSVRLGQRIFIPQPALEDLIQRCLMGEKD